MKIHFGDLLSVTSGIIVHGCNAQSVMGSGVAYAIKSKYPAAYEDYMHHLSIFNYPSQALGTVAISHINDDLRIINAITQLHYGTTPGRKYVSYESIGKAFSSIKTYACDLDMQIHFPLIGAGLGGGDWGIIRQVIEHSMGSEIKRCNLWIKE